MHMARINNYLYHTELRQHCLIARANINYLNITVYVLKISLLVF